MEFLEYYFSPPPMIISLPNNNNNHKFLKVVLDNGHFIWPYLQTIDILNFSVTSKTSTGLILPDKSINAILQADKRVNNLAGEFQISMNTPMTLGVLRRTLFQLVHGKTLSISIGTNGRILLDIGSIYNDKDSYLASATTALSKVIDSGTEKKGIQEINNDATDMCMEKRLEIISYDEYDDFIPRHPLPKEKTHRRGNSLFNSDIEVYANQALNQRTHFNDNKSNMNSIYSANDDHNNNHHYRHCSGNNELNMNDIATLVSLELNDEAADLTEVEAVSAIIVIPNRHHQQQHHHY